jgi:hypothetical protein
VVFHATAGDAESGDTDERSVQFPDGSADDWAVEDFVLTEPKKKKKQLPRYAVLARQGIRREAGAARNGLLLVVIISSFLWLLLFNNGSLCQDRLGMKTEGKT